MVRCEQPIDDGAVFCEERRILRESALYLARKLHVNPDRILLCPRYLLSGFFVQPTANCLHSARVPGPGKYCLIGTKPLRTCDHRHQARPRGDGTDDKAHPTV